MRSRSVLLARDSMRSVCALYVCFSFRRIISAFVSLASPPPLAIASVSGLEVLKTSPGFPALGLNQSPGGTKPGIGQVRPGLDRDHLLFK